MILFICIFINRKCNCIMKCGVAGRMEIMGTKVNLNKELNGYLHIEKVICISFAWIEKCCRRVNVFCLLKVIQDLKYIRIFKTWLKLF